MILGVKWSEAQRFTNNTLSHFTAGNSLDRQRQFIEVLVSSFVRAAHFTFSFMLLSFHLLLATKTTVSYQNYIVKLPEIVF